jgi:hypothetical protein
MTVNSLDEEAQWTALGFEPVTIPAHAEFPVAMVHPNYESAKMLSAETHGAPVSADSPMAATARLFSYVPTVWEPEHYPPVVAKNAEEERQFAAKGYGRAGTSDRAAFSSAVEASLRPREESREFCEFPKYLTSPQGEAVLVKSAQQEDVLRAQWSDDTKKREGVSRGKATA